MSQTNEHHISAALEKLDNLEAKVEILEDLVQGDEDRAMTGAIADIKGLRGDLYNMVRDYEHDKVLIKGIGYGLGFTSFASIATLVSQLLGLGAGA